ncbi:MAG: hypothetical protein LZF62_180022 [Nitrospira sp.]|nr:MAG: hypothetical protein LZF62_180022 [Nitrospira sp.]
MPHTGTEMEARPFGTDPETGTGATPEPTLRCTEAGCPELILVPPPFIYYLCNHAEAEINEVIGPNAAPPGCPVSPHWDDDAACLSPQTNQLRGSRWRDVSRCPLASSLQ